MAVQGRRFAFDIKVIDLGLQLPIETPYATS